MINHPRYCANTAVNHAVTDLVDRCDINPYAPERVRNGRHSAADVIYLIGFSYGPRAAASVKITVH